MLGPRLTHRVPSAVPRSPLSAAGPKDEAVRERSGDGEPPRSHALGEADLELFGLSYADQHEERDLAVSEAGDSERRERMVESEVGVRSSAASAAVVAGSESRARREVERRSAGRPTDESEREGPDGRGEGERPEGRAEADGREERAERPDGRVGPPAGMLEVLEESVEARERRADGPRVWECEGGVEEERGGRGGRGGHAGAVGGWEGRGEPVGEVEAEEEGCFLRRSGRKPAIGKVGGEGGRGRERWGEGGRERDCGRKCERAGGGGEERKGEVREKKKGERAI